ncbi:PGF-CTERM protein/PGF-pre-PGF domain-containing protein [Halorubrum xinjiangense]|uniref:PGF-CTERM protein/PGF-pre-PGF domain-containing protein n=1 Tax=Halorubrum xinjiangense TaxID=261291 RepID=A0A1G7JQR3_9EURY|nr:PGF-pre-PGF domain-containing protein [Halorubrum xinjiangense]SDF27211.1 PGF-CTERM protein/PGF-pre-PGF domain-containing protein [Halorubrum xinjiangense]
MRSESPDRPTKFVVIATLAALLLVLGALGALSAVGVAAEAPSQTADGDPFFAVEITDYDAAVTEGDALVVEATVTNEGTTADSQQIHLKDDRNNIVDSVASPALTLEPNESKDVTLTWDTGPGDAGTERIKVVSDHGADNRTVQIDEGSFFTVEGVETDSPVEAGDDLTATVTVTNDDPNVTTRDVWIEVDGDSVAESAVELAPGETQSQTLTWTDTADSAGNWSLAAATTGDRLTTEVTVTESESSESTDGSDGSDGSDDSTDGSDESTDDDDGGSANSSDDSAKDDDEGSSSGWSIPTYVEKRDNGAVEGDGVVELPANEVAVVDFDRETVSGLLIVDKLRELPEGVTAPDEAVGMYRIDPDDEFADENATVTFAYSNETLEESALDRVEVVRWNGTAWTELDAEATSADGRVTVDAETRGFSLFAVTTGGESNATAGAESPANTTPGGEAAADANATSSANETADSEAADADANSTDTDETDANSTDTNSTDTNSTDTDETGADETDEDAASNDSETETADDSTTDATEASEDETPGFGVVAALLALAVTAGVATRGRRRE